ncbi:hypothetical protein L917_01115 [Phytophthora nicotianae]|nr:hypothetical protein L917_01115 [Phytophthora nicotianae]
MEKALYGEWFTNSDGNFKPVDIKKLLAETGTAAPLANDIVKSLRRWN